MATDLLKPRRGGFLRAFGCGEFIRDYLAGNGPYGARAIDSSIGACQADIFYEYKMALIRETALDRAVRLEEKQAKREKRPINPENIQSLSEKSLSAYLISPTAAATLLSSLLLHVAKAGLGGTHRQ